MWNALKQWYRRSDFYVRHRSRHQNVYHCTIQKAGSQWVCGLLSDERTYRYCGLNRYQYESAFPAGHDPRKIIERRFTAPFPPATIATPIYIDYAGFASILKPACYKAFFVMRDPRDVLVSWYFSIKHSHPSTAQIDGIRRDLANLAETEGLLYALDFLHDYGLFAAQRSWADAPAQDANVLLVRFEDLIGPEHRMIVERLFAHCDIIMPSEVLDAVLQTNSFESLSGRQPGQEDATAHYRKGVSGDWRNHFHDARLQARFAGVAGDLLSLWNYA